MCSTEKLLSKSSKDEFNIAPYNSMDVQNTMWEIRHKTTVTTENNGANTTTIATPSTL